MTSQQTVAIRGACECGTCSFSATEAPRTRLRCHCNNCQAFTGKGFSDVAILPEWKVRLTNEDKIFYKHYKKLRWPPPNLYRGRCTVCDRPVIETWGVAPLRLFFLPAANFERPDVLPGVGVHVFYEHRQEDAKDDVPKYQGYIASQMAIGKMIMGGV